MDFPGMPPDLLEFRLDGGGSILVEVEPAPRGPVTRGGGGDAAVRVVAAAEDSLQKVLAGVGPAVSGVLDQFRDSTRGPDEVTVEFSVKLAADAGVIIARTSGEANFKVTAKWSRPQPST